jgi:hypothetical protein
MCILFNNFSADQQQTRLPDSAPTLIFSFFLDPSSSSSAPPGSSEEKGTNHSNGNGKPASLAKEEAQSLLLNFTFHLLEKVRRYRLSREAKSKADKKRASVEEQFLKLTHNQRQEAAQVFIA